MYSVSLKNINNLKMDELVLVNFVQINHQDSVSLSFP